MTIDPRHRPTRTHSREVIHENSRFRVLRDDIEFHTGKPGVHWKIDYAAHGVGVVPVTSDGRVLLGLHWRYCIERWTWEIVAGGVDPGEDHESAARRELEEETGRSASGLRFLFDYHPAPGLGNEHFHTYLATGLGEPERQIDNEEIYELRAFTWAEIDAMMADGRIGDGFTVTALLYARLHGHIPDPQHHEETKQ